MVFQERIQWLKQRYVGLVIVILALLHLAAGFLLPPQRKELSLTPLMTLTERDLISASSGFARDAVYPTTIAEGIPRNLVLLGSWMNTDATTGRCVSSWFSVKDTFCLMVAGYPLEKGNSLVIEVATQSGLTRSLYLTGQNPGEKWRLEKFSVDRKDLPAKARVTATDGTRDLRGWLGFSMPFDYRSYAWLTAFEITARLILGMNFSFLMVIGTGLALRGRHSSHLSLRWSLSFIPLPGIALLLAIGIICWWCARAVPPQVTTALLTLPIVLICGYRFVRVPLVEIVSPAEKRALVIIASLVLLATAKATFSPGPVGELYGGSVSRTLEVGGRSDSRIPYHIVQLAAHGTKPYSSLGNSYFAPWSFSSRGPFAGLAVSPLVFSCGARVPREMPDQSWYPFDPQGFVMYRIGMCVMAAASLLVLFGAATSFFQNERAGLYAVALCVLCPFIVHETYFTWPKMLAAGFVILAAHCLHRQRFGWSGFFIGIGYLFHPLTLLSAPFLGLGIFWRPPESRTRRCREAAKTRLFKFLSLPWRLWIKRGFLYAGPLLLILAIWRLLNGEHYTQSGFLSYFFEADGVPAHSSYAWLKQRLTSVMNTLIPGYLYAFHRTHRAVNSIWGPSPEIVRFFFQYWNNLFFGFGLLGLPFFCRTIWRAAKYTPIPFLTWIVLPFLFFTAFWGSTPTGMMREGLHAWFFALILFITLATMRGNQENAPDHTVFDAWLLAGRGVEVLLMCLLPTLLTFDGDKHAIYFKLNILMSGALVLTTASLMRQCFPLYLDSHKFFPSFTNVRCRRGAAATPCSG